MTGTYIVIMAFLAVHNISQQVQYATYSIYILMNLIFKINGQHVD